jgi:hypothetical protein
VGAMVGICYDIGRLEGYPQLRCVKHGVILRTILAGYALRGLLRLSGCRMPLSDPDPHSSRLRGPPGWIGGIGRCGGRRVEMAYFRNPGHPRCPIFG